MGGGGSNAIARMMELGMRGVEFIVANTDHQALESNPAPTKIQLGPHVTRGLGAGGDPRIGQAAAQESCADIAAALQGADMVFLTAGMGGGTGTGSIPVAAEIARSLGAVTIAVVTTPFTFEMGRRQRNANEGLAQLRQHAHTLIAIPNDRLLYVAPRNLPLETTFRLADDVLRQAVQGIAELITEPGFINVDFAHIRRLMQLGGGALMSIGQGEGENKAQEAIEQALHHPLMDSVSLYNAAGIIANFTGGSDLTLYEIESALSQLQDQSGSKAEIVMGVTQDERMQNRAQVILVVTGLGGQSLEEALSSVSRTVSPAHEVASPTRPVAAAPALAQAAAVSEPVYYTPSPEAAPQTNHSNNLDIPAFLRRRIRYAG
jgi:cell division protein FtsZ